MSNLELYDKMRNVPNEAKTKITGAGALSGFTNINPMWRIKKLTEMFGVCGVGWHYRILRMWTEEGNSTHSTANVHIALRVKISGEWSEDIEGIGGSIFTRMIRGGKDFSMSDECYKMALTDALSVACKALGIGADVYFESDKEGKYKEQPNHETNSSQVLVCTDCGSQIVQAGDKSPQDVATTTKAKYGVELCAGCFNKRKRAEVTK